METLDDLTLYSMALGLVLPHAISAITRRHWPDRAKALTAYAVYAVAGAGLAYYQGAFTGGGILRAVMMVALFSYVLFKGLYKPIGLSGFIERATSPGEE